jgi:hypothetical protein
MKREPEEALRSLPRESPPPEIVLGAIRVFRYRALAVVALALALVLVALIAKSALEKDARLLERIGALRYENGVVDVADVRAIDGVTVAVWEVVLDDDAVFIHVFAWDESGTEFTLALSEVEADGIEASFGSVEALGGGRLGDRTHAELWQEVRLSAEDTGVLTFDVDVLSADRTSVPFEVRIGGE